MSVSNTPTALQAILQQIQSTQQAPAQPALTPDEDPSAGGSTAQTANAEPRVQVPQDAATFDPNAPRGSYVNLVV